jgi:ribosomal protein S18
LDTCNILSSEGVGNVDFKTVSEMYQEAVYTTNDDCRRYQKSNNPEALKDTDLLGIYPSREELLAEIQAVNAKVEALNNYVAELVKVTTKGLTGIADRLVD